MVTPTLAAGGPRPRRARPRPAPPAPPAPGPPPGRLPAVHRPPDRSRAPPPVPRAPTGRRAAPPVPAAAGGAAGAAAGGRAAGGAGSGAARVGLAPRRVGVHLDAAGAQSARPRPAGARGRGADAVMVAFLPENTNGDTPGPRPRSRAAGRWCDRAPKPHQQRQPVGRPLERGVGRDQPGRSLVGGQTAVAILALESRRRDPQRRHQRTQQVAHVAVDGWPRGRGSSRARSPRPDRPASRR